MKKILKFGFAVLFTIISFTAVAQNKGAKKDNADSLDFKTVSIRELEGYLNRINLVAMKQFDISQKVKYDEIFKEILAVYTEADKKRKIKQ